MDANRLTSNEELMARGYLPQAGEAEQRAMLALANALEGDRVGRQPTVQRKRAHGEHHHSDDGLQQRKAARLLAWRRRGAPRHGCTTGSQNGSEIAMVRLP